MRSISRRRFFELLAGAPLVAAVGCQSGGFSVLGYRVGAGALYDENIRTVYVPLITNRAFQTTPYRGFEVDLTLAVVREIGKTTAFRTTSNPEKADTELLAVVVSIDKTRLNLNQQNQIREGEVVVAVDVVWRDLRTGEVLSNPRKLPKPGELAPQPGAQPVPFDPNAPLVPPPIEVDIPVPVRLVASGRFLPELGETNASGSQRVYNQLAVQIVSMMEKKW